MDSRNPASAVTAARPTQPRSASKKGNGKKAKPDAKAEIAADEKAAATKVGNDAEKVNGPVKETQAIDLVTLYRRMLETLPAELDKLAGQAPAIAGKAMAPKDALETIVRLYAALDDLHDAEEKLVK